MSPTSYQLLHPTMYSSEVESSSNVNAVNTCDNDIEGCDNAVNPCGKVVRACDSPVNNQLSTEVNPNNWVDNQAKLEAS